MSRYRSEKIAAATPLSSLTGLCPVQMPTWNASEIAEPFPHFPSPLSTCEAKSQSLRTATTGKSTLPSLETTPIPILNH